METLCLVISGMVLIGCALGSYRKCRDPLAPAVLFAPVLFYVYVWHPGRLLYYGHLHEFFGDRSLDLVFFVHATGLAVFCLSVYLASGDQPIDATREQAWFFAAGLSAPTRAYLSKFALFAGVVSVVVVWSMIYSSGGLQQVLLVRKPYLRSPIDSGYYRELMKLGYLAIMLQAAAWQGEKLTVTRVVWMLLLGQAPILEATICGRRGPMALVIMSLGAAWFIIRSRRPNLRVTVTGVLLIGAMSVLLGENRNRLFQPFEYDVEFEGFISKVAGGEEVGIGDEFVSASANIILTDSQGLHYWGLRILSLVIIRPIPAFIWPEKYESVGLGWMVNGAGTHGISELVWLEETGVDVQTGSAIGFIADLFVEFSWGYLIACLALGRFFGRSYRRFVDIGGGYSLLYLLISILSLYLFSQSLGAWLEKVFILGIPLWFTWRAVRRIQAGSV